MFSKILLGLLVSFSVLASFDSAERIYGKGTISLSGYRRTIIEMVDSGYYFSVIPWMKDFLVKNNKMLDRDLELAFDKMLYVTGVKPFETLPEVILQRSQSGNVRYILGKRYYKLGRYQDALNELNKVNGDHPAYPFVAHLKASVQSALGNTGEAESLFRDCVRVSDRMASKVDSKLQKEQLIINRDYCTAGISRVHFARKDYSKAELGYLDIRKESMVWPEVLFEEAWTSYYMKNYNRTLGKLVSYKAPVFDFIFKPEVEVLTALSYMKMCLYEDAQKAADDFYTKLLEPSKELRSFLNSRGKDYRYYYGLMADFEDGKQPPLPILESILKSVRKEAAFIEMRNAFALAIAEHNKLRKQENGAFKSNLNTNLKVVMDEYRTLLGAFIRAGMVAKYAELYYAFQGMSYIKLEILAQRKEKLYQSDRPSNGKKRGDVRYIERNDKQYFWTFNGEFWADELGDYVFALRSEC